MLIDHAALPATPPATPGVAPATLFGYRWTLPRQRAFLDELAASGSVTAAAQRVGVSPRAAYALRHRRDGMLFALGWQAAVLIARYRLTDELLERALGGQEHVSIRQVDPDNGRTEVRQQRCDNRLGLTLLSRLDRMADAAAQTDAGADDTLLARLIAQDFEGFLDALAPPPAPDMAGASPDAAEPAFDGAETAFDPDDDFTDALADAMLGVSALLTGALEQTHPLLRLQAQARIHCEHAQKSGHSDPIAVAARARARTLTVWCDSATGKMQTNFPPPPDFDGTASGVHVHAPYYARDLSDTEAAIITTRFDYLADKFVVEGSKARDRWFDDPEPAALAAGAVPPLPEWRKAIAAPVAPTTSAEPAPLRSKEPPMREPRETLDETIERLRRRHQEMAERAAQQAETGPYG